MSNNNNNNAVVSFINTNIVAYVEADVVVGTHTHAITVYSTLGKEITGMVSHDVLTLAQAAVVAHNSTVSPTRGGVSHELNTIVRTYGYAHKVNTAKAQAKAKEEAKVTLMDVVKVMVVLMLMLMAGAEKVEACENHSMDYTVMDTSTLTGYIAQITFDIEDVTINAPEQTQLLIDLAYELETMTIVLSSKQ